MGNCKELSYAIHIDRERQDDDFLKRYNDRHFRRIHHLRSLSIVLFLDCINPFREPFINEVESGKHKYAEDQFGGFCQHLLLAQISIAQHDYRTI